MVKAVIDMTDHTNRVLNVVKAKYGLNDKSEAVELVVTQFEEEMMEPELRPEYIEKLKKIEKTKSIPVKNFAEHFKLK